MAQPQKDKTGPQGTRMFDMREVPKVESVAEPEIEPVDGVALRGKSADLKNQTFPLRKGSNSVGRKDSNDIHLPHGNVSAQHARISHRDGTWQVTNLLSSNGTFVNGERVTRRELVDGDEVSFGDRVFIFQDRGASKRSYSVRFGLFAAAVAVIVTATALLMI